MKTVESYLRIRIFDQLFCSISGKWINISYQNTFNSKSIDEKGSQSRMYTGDLFSSYNKSLKIIVGIFGRSVKLGNWILMLNGMEVLIRY